MCIIQEAEKNAKIDGFSNTVNEMILTNASNIYKITLIKTSIVEEDSYILAVLFYWFKKIGLKCFVKKTNPKREKIKGKLHEII